MSAKIMVSIRLKVAPAAAFELFTRKVDDWWRKGPKYRMGPQGRLRFEPGEGGRLIETRAGGKVFEIGRIRAWDPPRRLVFGWRQAAFAPGMDTEVEVRFDPVGEETRVTVEHFGWDSVPAAHVARHGFPNQIFLTRHAEWWRALLASYRAGIGGGG